MQIADLFARIGIKADDAQVKRFDRGLKNLRVGMTAATVVAGGVSLAIKKITTDAMAGAVAFKQFETETGASAQELQKWQAVAEQTNQSAESVTSAIKALAAHQEKIKLGQGNISGFQLLGIDPQSDPFVILEKLRDETNGLSNAMKKNILSTMGVGAGMLQTLSLTEKEFDAMASRAFIISPGAIETLNRTKSSVDLAGRAIKYIKTQIAVGLSPQITKLTKQFTTFIKVNERGIIKGFQQGFKFVKLFMSAISNTWRVINNVVTATLGWERALKGIAIGFAAFNLVLMASPLNMIIAGIILLVAVMDDLYVYSKGGNSLFGKMVEQFPALGKAFDAVFGTIKDVFDLLVAFGSGDEFTIDKILEQWGILGDIIGKIKEGIEYITGAEFKTMQAEQREKRGGVLSGYERMMGVSGGGNTTTNDVTITVEGAGDPNAVGDSVLDKLKGFLTGAQSQRSRDE